MPSDGFEANVLGTGTGSRIELFGTVDRQAKEPFEAAYEQATASPGEIVLDFGNVDYINSTGIAVIVGVLAMARAERRDIGAVGLSEHYREVFRITRLSDFMHIYEDAGAGT
jgi:anti-sigma B factor antagonist